MYFFTSEFNDSTGFENVTEGNKAHTTIYSPFYDELDIRLTNAINVYLHSNIVSHVEVDVKFYFDGGDLAIDGNSRYLFTHYSPIL